MDNLTITRKTRRLAKELLKQAKENEPQITVDLQNIASEIFAQIVGLENKFKTEESLRQKLLLLIKKDNSNQSARRKLEKFARRNNDTLRYTFIFQKDEYAQNFHNAIEKLEQKGFVIPRSRIWNAWENEETSKDTGYRGINITVISSQNQRFELQFHTAESFRFKTETHYLYKELSDLETFDKRREEIIAEMLLSAKQIKRPEGI
jgi:hypothetical protein